MTKDEKTVYWWQQVDGFQANGLSVKNYCAQEEIAVATLHYWRKRFADAVERKRLSDPPLRVGFPALSQVWLTLGDWE